MLVTKNAIAIKKTPNMLQGSFKFNKKFTKFRLKMPQMENIFAPWIIRTE